MNSRERVLTAFEHREADRVPVFETIINAPVAGDLLGRETWVGLGGKARGKIYHDMVSSGRAAAYFEQRIQDRTELYLHLGLDMMPALPYPTDPAPWEQLSETTWREERYPGIWFIHTYDPEFDMLGETDSLIRRERIPAFERMVEAMEAGTPSLAGLSFYEYEYARAHAPGLALMTHADVAVPSEASWLDVYLECMIARPDLIDRYLDVRLAQTLLELDKMLELGIDVIWGAMDLAGKNGPLFSPRHYAQFYLPRMREITGRCAAAGVPFFKHTDGDIKPMEEVLLAQSGVNGFHAIEPSAGMDIRRLKAQYRGKLTLLGNVDCAQTLVYGSPDDIRAEVVGLLRDVSPGGGHVLSSSNSIHSDVPTKNYLAMLAAVHEFGAYPIRV
ncbi:MAG: hypothetical protein JXB47_09645 [Anaerolineae bacterium]|nr:hypothetical protein [Anaerolineae bacterium]